MVAGCREVAIPPGYVPASTVLFRVTMPEPSELRVLPLGLRGGQGSWVSNSVPGLVFLRWLLIPLCVLWEGGRGGPLPVTPGPGAVLAMMVKQFDDVLGVTG